MKTNAQIILTSIIIIIHNMFENNSSISIRDNKSQRIIPASDCCSLPNIYQKLPSNKQIQTPPNLHHKQKLKLPNINEQPHDLKHYRIITQPQQNHESPYLSAKPANKRHKNTFARQMEERMRFVVGGLQTNNKGDFMEGYQSDDFDFQAKVNANRQLIKMHRQKNDKKNPSSVLQKRPPMAPQSANKKLKRKESMANKKAVNISRDKDRSIENKEVLNKRKNSVKRPVGTPNKKVQPFGSRRQSLKDLRSKQYNIPKTETNKKAADRKERINSQQSGEKGQSVKLKIELNKQSNLFDGIQNYLSNPASKKHSVNNKIEGLSLLKAKRDLQDKIKEINKKLGIMEEKEIISPSTTHQSQGSEGMSKISLTEKQWKRVMILNKEMSYEETNFDKEIDRLTEMQQKNCVSLQKYLEHQKILMELQLSKKMRIEAKVHASNSQ